MARDKDSPSPVPWPTGLVVKNGSNIESARYSGINTRKVLVLVYVLSGAIAAIAGIIITPITLTSLKMRRKRSLSRNSPRRARARIRPVHT